MATDKIYAPINVKARDGRFGEEFRISAQGEKLIEFIRTHTNAKGYINFGMTKRRETGKYGETHSVVLDTWEPTPSTGAGARRDAGYSGRHNEPVEDSDAPF